MLTRRRFLRSTAAGLAAGAWPGAGGADDRPVTRIAFGSCCRQRKDQAIWRAMAAAEPDLFLFLGDTVYADAAVVRQRGPIDALRQAYQTLAGQGLFARFRDDTPMLATWDDHDYGQRDGGGDFAHKEAARQLFLDFWQVGADDPRRHQPDGLYGAWQIGPAERRIQILLLDTRFRRDRLLMRPDGNREAALKEGFGPYLPNPDPDARLLGADQWAWLEEELRRPARLRLIGSSIQFAAGYRGWESWENFPREKARLIALIARTHAAGVLFVSGDIHYGELSRETRQAAYPLWDLTSSGLTHFWPTPGPNANRVEPETGTETVHRRNFGLLDVAWEGGQARVGLEIRDHAGGRRLWHTVALDRLRAD